MESSASTPAASAKSSGDAAHSQRCLVSCGLMKDIFTWKNTVLTSAVLAVFNVSFLLFLVSNISLVGLMCFSGLLIMAIGFLCSMITYVSSKKKSFFFRSEPAESDKKRVEVVTKPQMEEVLVHVYDTVNSLATQMRSIILWKNHAASAKSCAFLAILAYTASWLSFGALLYLGINSLFFFRHICQAYEKFAAPYVQKGVELLKLYLNKIPKMTPHAKTH